MKKVLLAIIIACALCGCGSNWEKDLKLTFIERVYKEDAMFRYDAYSVTNLTNKTLKNVVATVSAYEGNVKFQKTLAYELKPGETKEVHIFFKDAMDAMEKDGKEPVDYFDFTIETVKYEKK